MPGVRVRLYPSKLNRVLNDPNGPVGRDLTRRAIRVQAAAKQNASGRPGPNVITGRLRSSIYWKLDQGGDRGLRAFIGSDVEYAGYVELGTDRAPAYPFLRPALEAAR